MPAEGKGKHQALLAHEDVKRWYDNLARGSKATADNYLRTLGRFLNAHDLDPGDFVALPPRERDDLLADFVTAQIDAGRAGSYVLVTKKVVTSWLDWHGEKLVRNIKVPNTSKRPALKDAHIPTQDELKGVLAVADARARAAVGLMAFSGVRPQVLGGYEGDDGLRFEDLVEARTEDGELVFDQVPTRVVIPGRLNKTGHTYFTFLGPEGCEYLAAYVRERAVAGEAVTAESPVLTPKKVDKPFMRSLNVSNVIRKPMRAAGLEEPPYMWRSYFASRTMLAEADGLSRDYRQFFMGHRGDIEHVYALHKQLPPDTVEAMRRGYQAALEYLETRPTDRREDPVLEMVGLFLQARGYSEAEVEEMDLAARSKEELIEIFRQEPGAGPHHNGNGSGVRQKVVHVEKLEKALAEGWTFKASLPDGRAVVERNGAVSGIRA